MVDRAPSPLAIAGYLARNGLSFQEADDLYKWVTAVFHEDAMGQEANADITSDLLVAGMSIEGSERSLEYYEERAEQGGSKLEFRDIESLPGDTHSLLRVEEAARYLPAPPQKKKRCSCHKTTDTDKEDSYLSFGKDSLGSDDSGPPWNPPPRTIRWTSTIVVHHRCKRGITLSPTKMSSWRDTPTINWSCPCYPRGTTLSLLT